MADLGSFRSYRRRVMSAYGVSSAEVGLTATDGAGSHALVRHNPKRNFEMSITQYRAGRVIAAAAILPAMLFAVSSTATSARAADTPTLSASSSHQAGPSRNAVEERITDLHKKLKVTAEQQDL